MLHRCLFTKWGHTTLIHPSQWFVQTSQAPPVGQAALRTPLGGLSGTPEPAACWRSCWMTSPGSPNPRLSANKTTWDSVMSALQGRCTKALLLKIQNQPCIGYLHSFSHFFSVLKQICSAKWHVYTTFVTEKLYTFNASMCHVFISNITYYKIRDNNMYLLWLIVAVEKWFHLESKQGLHRW